VVSLLSISVRAKGRVLLTAADFLPPVVGLEQSSDLNQIAAENIRPSLKAIPTHHR
jgi:hypothetical protein